MSVSTPSNPQSIRASSTPRGAKSLWKFAVGVAGVALDRAGRVDLARGENPRSGQPVWRNSYTVGQIEGRLWRPINGGSKRGGSRWTAGLLKRAKKHELLTRARRRETDPGARNGDLGEVGIAVLEFLYATVDFATGRLEPAIRTIATEIGRSYSAVHEALKRLRDAQYLSWMRRSEPIEDPEPDGPQVRQVSNAYALLCPPEARDWLARLIGKPPAAECDADRRKREAAEYEAMLANLTAVERLDATWRGGVAAGDTLRRIAASVDAREKQDRESCRSDETGEIIL